MARKLQPSGIRPVGRRAHQPSPPAADRHPQRQVQEEDAVFDVVEEAGKESFPA